MLTDTAILKDQFLFRGLRVLLYEEDNGWVAAIVSTVEVVMELRTFRNMSRRIVESRVRSWINSYRNLEIFSLSEAGDLLDLFGRINPQKWSYFAGEEHLQADLERIGIDSRLQGDDEEAPLVILEDMQGRSGDAIIVRRCGTFLIFGAAPLVLETLAYLKDHADDVAVECPKNYKGVLIFE